MSGVSLSHELVRCVPRCHLGPDNLAISRGFRVQAGPNQLAPRRRSRFVRCVVRDGRPSEPTRCWQVHIASTRRCRRARRNRRPAPHRDRPRPAALRGPRSSHRTTSATGASRSSTSRAGRGRRSPGSSGSGNSRSPPTPTRTCPSTAANSTTHTFWRKHARPGDFRLPPTASVGRHTRKVASV
jgi:hypothetical protein